jgi:hypothetical protein
LFKAAATPQLFLGHGAQRVWRRTQQGSRIQPLTEPAVIKALRETLNSELALSMTTQNEIPNWGKFKTIGSQFLVENI